MKKLTPKQKKEIETKHKDKFAWKKSDLVIICSPPKKEKA